ncbi:MAG: MXAN_6640 family putative metalloprotease [Labilithrix sp.]
MAGWSALAALGVLLGAKTASAACVGRPTDPAGFASFDYATAAEVKSFAGTKVRVHYATSGTHAPTLTSTRADGVPDTVAFAATTGDEALTKYEAMGYHAIPSDAACPSNGGDALVDIYLVHFTAADGSTHAECEGGQCSSFALVESTFKGKGYASAQEGFRTVVSHELFHAVQNTYKPADAPFWAEGTAQWAMKKVHPELADFERQLPAFFAEPSRSIEAPPSGVTAGFLYGSAVWPLFLSLRHGDDLVRAAFEGEADGAEPLAAIDQALKALPGEPSSLADEYPLFAAWNVGTGKLKSAGGYPDAAKYPGQKTEKLADGASDITSGFGYFAYKGTLGAEQNIRLETDATRNAGVVVPIVDDVLELDQAKKLPANANGSVLVIVSGITTKKSDAKFTIHIGDPAAETPEPGADAGASSRGAAPPPAAAPPADDGGCQTGGTNGPGPLSSAGLLALGLLIVRRRR